MQITSLPTLQCGSFPCCQRCFLHCFQLCIGFHQLAFLSCRYVEIAAFFVFLHPCFYYPKLVLGPPGSVDRGSDHGVACFFHLFLHTAKVWTESCIRRLCWDWVTHPFQQKLITSSESGELADLLCLYPCRWPRAQVILDGKLLVPRKRQLVEVEDILMWTEAFTIYQTLICASHPHPWFDQPKYNCWSSQLFATRLVICVLIVTLASERLWRLQVHLVNDELQWGRTGGSEPPASCTLLSHFPYLYLLPPALFCAAPVSLIVSLFCNLTAYATHVHSCRLTFYDLHDITTVNRFTISPEVSLFFSPSANFRLLVCSEVSIVTEKTLNASQI